MSEIGSYLSAGERVIWQGRPQKGLRLVGRDAFIVPFSLFWAAGAIGIPATMLASGAEIGAARPIVYAMAAFFLAAAVYITVGRLFHDAWIRSRTHYALTDRRALILRGDDLTGVELDRVEQINLKGGKDGGRGTIRFGRAPSLFHFYGTMGWYIWLPSLEPTPQFIGIEGARGVYDRILAIRGRPAV